MDTNANSTMFYAIWEHDITISGLTLDGNRDNNTKGVWPHSTGGAVILSRTSHTLIENCIVQNFWYGTTACGQYAYDNKWIGNYFYNNGTDIDTYGTGTIILGNVSADCTGASFQIEPCPTAGDNIDETEPYDPNWVVKDYVQGLESVILGNTIRGADYGMVIHPGTVGCTISNNTIANIKKSGINCYHNKIKDIIISNNTIRYVSGTPNNNGLPWSAVGSGICIASPMGCIITNNIIEYAHVGIYTKNSQRIIITDNICAYNDTSGICVYGCTGGLIKNNLLYNNDVSQKWWANSGILLHNSTDLVVAGNQTIETADLHNGQRNCVHIYSKENSNLHIGENYSFFNRYSLQRRG